MFYRLWAIFLLSLLILLFQVPIAFAVSSPSVPITKSTLSHTSMVASEHFLATQVGLNILKQGGNAIDAAVAMGYALAVVYPCCGNIGGGGFMLIRMADGNFTFINFREKAPLAATENMFVDANGKVRTNKSIKGYLAVAVPGTVMGLNTALKKYGTMTLEQVIAPAIYYAENGYLLQSGDVELLKEKINDFQSQTNVAAIFLKNGKPFQVDDRLVQTDLANTLKLVLQNDSNAFYKGDIADKVVNSAQQNGGILTKKDFSNYSIEELHPVSCQYRGYTIYSAPPPSSGGATLCEMLNILEPYPLAYFGYHSSKSIHYLAEAMRLAYSDRNTKLGDPDFIHNPLDQLLNKEYAARMRSTLLNYHATPTGDKPKNTLESTSTTHYSIVDRFGNAVAVTYTINNYFGAKVIAGDTGFFLNSVMDDFTTKIGVPNQFGLEQGSANRIQPGKRPLSAMTPTIVTKGGKLVMVLGTPGGSTIMTSVLQVILNVIDYRMTIQAAVDAPRIHFQGQPDIILYEPNSLSLLTKAELTFMGYNLQARDYWGSVQAIQISDQSSRTLYGGSDFRHTTGQALGY